MPSIRITVGASADASLGIVFKSLIEAARQARTTVASEMEQSVKMIGSAYRGAPAYTKPGFDGIEKQAKDSAEKAAEAAKDGASKCGIEWERAMKAAERSMRSFASSASSTMRSIGGAAFGVAGSIARGAGVNFDIGHLVGKGVGLEKAATSIAASGYMDGDTGANGKRVSGAALQGDIRHAANSSALSNDAVAEGLQRFTSKSSDLDTGRKSLEFMAKFAKSTSSDMGDVADAMGEVVNKLGDVPDKAKALESVMMVMAKQGKLGSVEMKDQAKSIAVIVGSANKFTGGAVEAMNELGTVFQMTKKFGGNKGAAQAATASNSFVSDLTSHAGQKNLKAAGMDVLNDKGHLKPLVDIVVDALKKTGGDLAKGGEVFRNKRSKTVVDAFGDTYNKAEAEKKGSGEAAIRAKFKEFGQSMSKEEFDSNLKEAMETTASKAQVFQNNLESVAAAMADRVLPQLERLAPKALELADAFGNLIAWAAENPGHAITAAIVASIGKAGLETALKVGVEAAIKGVAGSPAASLLGTAGIALSIATATLMIESAIITQKHSEGIDKAKEGDAAIGYHLKKADSGQGDKSELEADLAAVKARIDAANSYNTSQAGRAYEVVSGKKSLAEQGQEKFDKDNMGTLQQELKGLVLALDAMKPKGGVQEVRVTNMPPGGGAPGGVDNSGRTGPQP